MIGVDRWASETVVFNDLSGKGRSMDILSGELIEERKIVAGVPVKAKIDKELKWDIVDLILKAHGFRRTKTTRARGSKISRYFPYVLHIWGYGDAAAILMELGD